MGTGFHGGFGKTAGYLAVAASPVFVGKGKGEELARVAKFIKPQDGFTDVVIHGESDRVGIMHNGEFKYIDHRRLAKLLKHSGEYSHNSAVRLISCSTGSNASGFAQNLANKLGVKVKAPSNTLWVFPNGRMVIGPTPFRNTGRWLTYSPYQKKGGK